MNGNLDYLTAGDSEASVMELCLLANNSQSSIRRRVAENSGCPHFILMRLLQDEDPEVRLSVASNRKANLRMLEMLAEDRCEDVRYALAEDHNLPGNLLRTLSMDRNPYVAHRARKTILRICDENDLSSLHDNFSNHEGQANSTNELRAGLRDGVTEPRTA